VSEPQALFSLDAVAKDHVLIMLTILSDCRKVSPTFGRSDDVRAETSVYGLFKWIGLAG
jgi:hypothetical protein